MTVSLLSEFFFFFSSLCFGAFSGFYYDLFRFLRAVFGKKKNALPAKKAFAVLRFSITFVSDFLCIALLGVFYTLFLYEVHNGVFRFYAFFSLVAGFWIYGKTLGKLVRFLLFRLAYVIRKCLSFLFYPVFRFFRNIFIPFGRYFKQKTLSFRKKCVKIISKKNKKATFAQNRKNIKKEPYGKTKRI